MGSPIGFPPNAGSGVDQLKATIMGWIRDEIRSVARGGIGLSPESILFNATGFAIPLTTGVAVASRNVVVPAGSTRAMVNVLARCRGVNPWTAAGANGVGGDYLAMVAQINGMQSDLALSTWIDGGGKSAVTYAPFANVLTGLVPGASFNLSIWAAMSYAALPVNPENMAEMSGTILWLR